MTLVRIVAPHFVAGLVLDDRDQVIEAAPILRYMRGYTADALRAYVARKGWCASRVSDAAGATVAIAAPMLRTEGSAVMSQQWPDPSNPNPSPSQNPPGEAPGAPHTPESPRETPQPRDPNRPDRNPRPDTDDDNR